MVIPKFGAAGWCRGVFGSAHCPVLPSSLRVTYLPSSFALGFRSNWFRILLRLAVRSLGCFSDFWIAQGSGLLSIDNFWPEHTACPIDKPIALLSRIPEPRSDPSFRIRSPFHPSAVLAPSRSAIAGTSKLMFSITKYSTSFPTTIGLTTFSFLPNSATPSNNVFILGRILQFDSNGFVFLLKDNHDCERRNGGLPPRALGLSLPLQTFKPRPVNLQHLDDDSSDQMRLQKRFYPRLRPTDYGGLWMVSSECRSHSTLPFNAPIRRSQPETPLSDAALPLDARLFDALSHSTPSPSIKRSSFIRRPPTCRSIEAPALSIALLPLAQSALSLNAKHAAVTPLHLYHQIPSMLQSSTTPHFQGQYEVGLIPAGCALGYGSERSQICWSW
ncbi:hypothetical protein BJ508DRAFT_333029 [Ascobolus immersus RN42]|uniref:Uncharacterized protein n=1 Tax=Ascobolus immersus RN42 TaxID=1160509 RepID=A0A3N4HQX7_ASCIM|nr:hypothetical protein BJ508DRAFT_333029 [Ascobolus immersus RN42]